MAVAKLFLRLLTDRRALEESRNQEVRRRIVEKSKELQVLEALELEQPTVDICQDKLSRPLTEALLERAWLYGEGRMELALLSKHK